MSKLQGKIALVTGGNSGIGLATAKLFVKEGANVIITGRNQETLDSAVTEIGNQTLAFRSEAGNLPEIDQVISAINNKFGKLDILFANAGIGKFSSLNETSEVFFDEMFSINVKGVFFTIQKAQALMQDGGAIIINASTVAHVGIPGASVYSATKAAIRQLARNLAMELVDRKIRVNVISPGLTSTALLSRYGTSEEQMIGMTQRLLAEIPMRRLADPEEIAKAVLFLASEESSYITGEEILADGGYSTIGTPGVQH